MGQLVSKEGISSEQKKYLGLTGAWALVFGCSLGWGSFVMPGTSFLPIAGPIGTAIGLTLGGLVMLILALNFHYLMNRYPAREYFSISIYVRNSWISNLCGRNIASASAWKTAECEADNKHKVFDIFGMIISVFCFRMARLITERDSKEVE